MSSDSEDDIPLAKRAKQVEEEEDVESSESEEESSETEKEDVKKRKPPVKREQPAKRSRSNGNSKSDEGKGEIMWTTLRHNGVLFPPEYEPHAVKMLYDGKPVTLTPEQEEVATMFAIMKETDYMNKPIFLKNFWEGFKELLGKHHVIKNLSKCDFTPIYDYHMAQREAKKSMSKEEKDSLKKEREEKEAKYKYAYVDGRQEQVGNFRVEPPALFRGRGEHPKMGKIKRRVFPRDITINIGKNEPIPEHPYPGQRWKEIKHDQNVTWLAYWKDTISTKDYKYVFLGATSAFKADSDLAKYEKARKLKTLIHEIRKNYEQDWDSPDTRRRQMGVALYFIDKLALRAGHEKDEDEADTVGCCTLKVENVELMPNHQVKFDFLGKDSIRYENVVDVDPCVYDILGKFRKTDARGVKKKPSDQLFETFDAQDLNKELKNIMDGLSVKVFRTYNASITLNKLLADLDERKDFLLMNTDEKKAGYDKANKEVAILCNHQRAVSKSHDNQIEKIQEKLNGLREELAQLEEELALALKGKQVDGKKVNVDSWRNKVTKKQQQIARMELQMRNKEDLKTVALGTSKINYMDPRITIAWCKRNDVPLEKVFNKSLLAKFNWAMEVEPEYVF